MGYTEFTGKTVDEALTAATVSLGLTSDQIDYEVVSEGSSGFLGIGSKDAVIKVISKEEKAKLEEETVNTPSVEEKVEATETPVVEDKPGISDEEVEKIARDFLNDVFAAMNLKVEMDVVFEEDDHGKTMSIDLKGPEMGIIIGKRGQTLDSLQYLVNLAVNRERMINQAKLMVNNFMEDLVPISTEVNYVRVKIDTEDYRRRRKETLENLAKNMAHKAIRTGRPVSLEAMNPYERRIIHAALADNNKITTHSEGEEPYRHVVITLKK